MLVDVKASAVKLGDHVSGVGGVLAIELIGSKVKVSGINSSRHFEETEVLPVFRFAVAETNRQAA
jgi:hypothetical protein